MRIIALANAGHDTRSHRAYLGHKNIRHTPYTELAPNRFTLPAQFGFIFLSPPDCGGKYVAPAAYNGSKAYGFVLSTKLTHRASQAKAAQEDNYGPEANK